MLELSQQSILASFDRGLDGDSQNLLLSSFGWLLWHRGSSGSSYHNWCGYYPSYHCHCDIAGYSILVFELSDRLGFLSIFRKLSPAFEFYQTSSILSPKSVGNAIPGMYRVLVCFLLFKYTSAISIHNNVNQVWWMYTRYSFWISLSVASTTAEVRKIFVSYLPRLMAYLTFRIVVCTWAGVPVRL